MGPVKMATYCTTRDLRVVKFFSENCCQALQQTVQGSGEETILTDIEATWFRCRLRSTGLTIGLSVLNGLSLIKGFYDSMIVFLTNVSGF